MAVLHCPDDGLDRNRVVMQLSAYLVHFWCIKIVRFVADFPDCVAGRTRERSGGNAVANRLLRLPCQLADLLDRQSGRLKLSEQPE